ncbi:hypothetical protein EV361DRAFT_811267 [Lentinula raphanica]|nr:hypothetical protein EV361DRAFT_811267 [Lentinula raphanica]
MCSSTCFLFVSQRSTTFYSTPHFSCLPTCSSSCHTLILNPYQTRKISFKIINSPTLLLPKWWEQLSGTDFADRTLLRDVATQWNSTHNMLESFLNLKDAVVEFLDRASNRLSEFALTEEEWEVAQGLVSALQDATLLFSADGSNLATVIPAMDAIDEAFASGILDRDNVFSEPMRHALGIGKKTLNKYYSLTDDSDLYRMAMGASS